MKDVKIYFIIGGVAKCLFSFWSLLPYQKDAEVAKFILAWQRPKGNMILLIFKITACLRGTLYIFIYAEMESYC